MLGKSFIQREAAAKNIFAPLFSLWACEVLFHCWAAFYVISFPLGEGEKKESVVKSCSWIVERPAYGECQRHFT